LGNAPAFIGLIAFIITFNTLLVIAFGSMGDEYTQPSFPSEPGLLDYIIYPFQWAGYIITLTLNVTAENPIIGGVLLMTNISLGYILIVLLRGGG
jgi:hypothetical protein